jgi:uncharacterized protein YihD (DUF1040 family)
MRNPKRIPIVLEKLKEYWEKNPDLRLGQLISIISAVSPNKAKNDDTFMAEDEGIDVFFMEDEEILSFLEKELE